MPQVLRYELRTPYFGWLLPKAELTFEFEGRTFRLIRGVRGEPHQVLTILDCPAEAQTTEQENIYETLSRFCDYLGWEWNWGIECSPKGGIGFRAGQLTLDNMPIYVPHPPLPKGVSREPDHIPDAQNETVKLALSLMNEARCSSSPFFSFINYWKVLELSPAGTAKRGKPEARVIAWINQIPEHKFALDERIRDELRRRGKSLGEYLWGDFRNAIMHVTRKPSLRPNNPRHQLETHLAAGAAHQLAALYICDVLGMGMYSKPVKVLKTRKRTTTRHYVRR